MERLIGRVGPLAQRAVREETQPVLGPASRPAQGGIREAGAWLGRWSSSSHSHGGLETRREEAVTCKARCAGRRRSTTCKAQRQGAAWVNVAPIDRQGQPARGGVRGHRSASDGATRCRPSVRPPVPCQALPLPSYIKHMPETKVRVCRVRSGALGWERNSPFPDPRRATVTTHTAQNVVAPAPLVGPPGGGVRRPSNQPIDISRWSGRDFCRPIQPLPLHAARQHSTAAAGSRAASACQLPAPPNRSPDPRRTAQARPTAT